MNSGLNYKYIFLLFIIFIFLFSNFKVYAEVYDDSSGSKKSFNYTSVDDGTDGPDVSDITFDLTCFGGAHLASGEDPSNFTTNEKYGWQEYEKDGVKYVVIATATHEQLNTSEKVDLDFKKGHKFDHIHYFRWRDTIQFKFEDQDFDSNVYNAIVLDNCGASMLPEHYKHKDGNNVIDIYFGVDGETTSQGSPISNKQVLVTMTGTFNEKANTKTKVQKNVFLELLSALFSVPADVVQILTNSVGNGKISNIVYAKDKIQNNNKLNEEIQVVDANTTTNPDEEQEEDENNEGLKEINVSNLAKNKRGNLETVFTNATKIPVMPVDAYSSSINKIDLLKIDFLNKNANNSHAFWNLIKDLVSIFSHMVLYVSAGLLIAMLIWRSILFVGSSIGNSPIQAFRSRKIMDAWIKAIALISLIYVVVALGENFYEYILSLILNNDESGYLLRVNVENVYSFNTNIIGYVKYLSLTANSISRLLYSIVYCIISAANFIWFIFMIFRMLAIAGLIIVAPITAITTMRENQPRNGSLLNILYFRNWLNIYLSLVFIPLVVIGVQKLWVLMI